VGSTSELAAAQEAQKVGDTKAQIKHDLIAISSILPGGKLAAKNTIKGLEKLVGKWNAKTKNYLAEGFSDETLAAAAKELSGIPTGISPFTGNPWDHVTKVLDTQDGAKKMLGQVEHLLGKANLSQAQRQQLERLKDKLKSSLEKSKRSVPAGTERPSNKPHQKTEGGKSGPGSKNDKNGKK
jgi:hypothetical protein